MLCKAFLERKNMIVLTLPYRLHTRLLRADKALTKRKESSLHSLLKNAIWTKSVQKVLSGINHFPMTTFTFMVVFYSLVLATKYGHWRKLVT